jgi:hypothetical protein
MERVSGLATQSIALLLIISTVGGCALHHVDKQASLAVSQVEVRVIAHEDLHAIPGASVRLLSDGGRELATATTDSAGLARLQIARADQAKYVMAERDGFYITGTRCTHAERYTLEMIVFRLFD